MITVTELCQKASDVKGVLSSLSSSHKNEVLATMSEFIKKHKDRILTANKIDLENGKANNMTDGLLDRLMLNDDRILGLCEGIDKLISLDDPVGEVLWMKTRPNGLKIGAKRVPMGVIAIIYEARPNVTVDAAALCFKAGSATILRGGKEAYHTSRALTDILRSALEHHSLPQDLINLIDDTTRDSAYQLMKQNKYVDVLIPRGGASLIASVVENSTVPVIETGTGNCHVYVDKNADFNMAEQIVFNSKCHRISVCNSAESLLVHKDIAHEFLPQIKALLDTKDVKLFGCDKTISILGADVTKATEEDYYTEYLDYKMSVKVVDTIENAIAHINKYSTGHSESIVTSDYFASQKFLDEVDSAAVYVNASTRFTDGFEFGFGAEIGISTQKLHARGPMGLTELTTIKYIVYGDGQIR